MIFSVITVCLNSEETIEKTIKSVLNQQGVDIEYIIVDGGSTDKTVEIIKKYESKIAYWCSEPDGGIYEAMNKGISIATGDVISFINSNDWYADDALSCVQHKMSESNFELVCGKVARVKNGMIVSTSIKPKEETDIYYMMTYLHPGIFACRTVFLEYGGFDLQYRINADYDWLLRVYSKGVRIAYIDTLVAYFSLGGVSYGHRALIERKAVSLKHLPLAWYNKYYPKIEEVYDKGMLSFKYRYVLSCIQNDQNLAKRIKRALPIDDKCSLFGTGIIARECHKLLQSLGVEVEHIYDNDQTKQGIEFWGIAVESPDNILPNENVVIGTTLYADIIKKQLAVQHVMKNIEFNEMKKIVVLCAEAIKGSPIDLEENENKMYNKGYCAGVYDLFHIGHVNLFRRAKEQCKHLVVGVLTDELVMHFKKNMPYVPFEERLQMVAACRYVDEAVPVTFETIGKIDAWDRYHYDAFFSGDDYEGNPVWMEEKRLLNERGSDIVFFPYTQTTSSTKIKQAITAQLEQSGNTQ